jgi:lipoate-protein ligase A
LEGRDKDISGKLAARPVSKSVSIDVPAEIWVLISKDELLKKAMERIAVEEFRKLLLKYFVAEEVTGVVDEKEIAEIDEELKEKIWEELKRKWRL